MFLGVKPATRHPRVVEFMEDIIRFVADLIEKGYAYMRAKSDVYFRVENPQLCKISQQNSRRLGARRWSDR